MIQEPKKLCSKASQVRTNPAELFSIYGIRIRDASPFEVTIVSSLSNGYCGYVPTSEAFRHRGYETHRTVYTSRLVKDGGDRIERHSVEQLQRGNEAAWKYAYRWRSIASRLRKTPAAWYLALLTNLGYRYYAHRLHKFYTCDWMLSPTQSGRKPFRFPFSRSGSEPLSVSSISKQKP